MFIQISSGAVTAEQMNYGAASKSTFLAGKCLLYTVILFLFTDEKKKVFKMNIFLS